MTIQGTEGILEFALEREKEAIRFYQGLRNKARFSEKRKLLEEIEQMEHGHIRAIEQIREKGVSNISVPSLEKIPDLHLADQTVAPPEGEEMSYQDILIIAIKKEESAYKLYTALAESQQGEARTLFLKLASEEAKHRRFFEELYDQEILSQD
jgi:rubrerythrin